MAYWRAVGRRAWTDTAQALGGLPKLSIAIALFVAVFIGPIIAKLSSLPPGSKWSAALDPLTYSGVIIDGMVFLWFLLKAAPRIHAEQQAEIAGSRTMRGQFRIQHARGCRFCDGPGHNGWPTLSVEVSDMGLGAESLKKPVLAIAAIEPTYDRILEYPVTVASWDALDPGAPAEHATVFQRHLDRNSFVIPRESGSPIWFVAAECVITLVAHAENKPPCVSHRRASFAASSDAVRAPGGWHRGGPGRPSVVGPPRPARSAQHCDSGEWVTELGWPGPPR